LQLKELLEPFGITRYYTDGWGAYERHLEADQHSVGKENTQKIASKHINLQTRIKREGVGCLESFILPEPMNSISIQRRVVAYNRNLLDHAL
jgi:hypothetical protein